MLTQWGGGTPPPPVFSKFAAGSRRHAAAKPFTGNCMARANRPAFQTFSGHDISDALIVSPMKMLVS
jgi:hypothetical protein